MSSKQMFVALRHKLIPASDWQGEGPDGQKVTVLSHDRQHVPDSTNCGEILFEIQASDGTKTTLAGIVGDKQLNGDITPSATETVSINGVKQAEADIDGGVAVKPVVRGFSLKFRTTVIVKFEYKDPAQPDGRAEYRFEGKVGDLALPVPG